jgi:alpha-L-arabinofuranosidase
MTGLERNSDIVVMASYAPLFVNVNPGGMQWPSDLIGYDAMNSYGSPSYYAQLLFSTHLGDQILDARLNARNPRLFAAATYDSKAHRLHLKLVNASSLPRPVSIKLTGAAHIRSHATVTTLSGNNTHETNSIIDPNRIVPAAGNIANAAANFTQTVPKYAIQVIDWTREAWLSSVLVRRPVLQRGRRGKSLLREQKHKHGTCSNTSVALRTSCH